MEDPLAIRAGSGAATLKHCRFAPTIQGQSPSAQDQRGHIEAYLCSNSGTVINVHPRKIRRGHIEALRCVVGLLSGLPPIRARSARPH